MESHSIPPGPVPESYDLCLKKEETVKKVYSNTMKKGSTVAKFTKTETVGSLPPIRTSQRQIKRPKMDDEVIDFESSSRGSTSKKMKASLSSNITPKSSTTVSSTITHTP